MNIIVMTAGGRVIARPDTTWVRKNEDFFPPDFVSALSFTPVLYARISKAGRCVGADFARRHFGETGCGVLLYPADLLSAGGYGVAAASCMDRTSYLPDLRESAPAVPRGSRESPQTGGFHGIAETGFRICRNGKEIFRTSDAMSERLMADAVVEASRIMYLRRDDLLAVELAAPEPLWSRAEGNTEISGMADEPAAALFDFNIVVE